MGHAPSRSTDDELDTWLRDPRGRAWFDEHIEEMRRSVSGNHFLYWSLGIGFVVGLAAHIGGYALRSSTSGEPLALIADLLYALGWALWTGTVVVLFVQVIPEVKRRQFIRALDAYEATRNADARTNGDASSERDRPPG